MCESLKVILSLKDVSFSYDGKRKILDHVSFEVKKGQTIALLGLQDLENLP